MLRTLDLFSCIGGHALGLHATGGFHTVAFVEADPWRRTVINYHYPDIPIYPDVRTFHGRKDTADVVVGGPPCQKTSTIAAIHGNRTGASLWPEMRRIISETEPAWIVVEQPPGNTPWETQVQTDLEGTGYHPSRLVLTAASLGAPHQRRRVFILAHTNHQRLQIARQSLPSQIDRIARGTTHRNPWTDPPPRSLRVADGIPTRLDRRPRIRAIGDSNPPIMMTAIGMAIIAAENP
jgi:DNA (cytosine-5)-methyltransferase 1